MNKNPYSVINLYEPLKTKLCEFYENDCIFDRFDLNISNDGKSYISGNYDNKFHICSTDGK